VRTKRDKNRKLILKNIDPNKKTVSNLFSKITTEWFEINKNSFVERHAETIQGCLKNYINPHLGFLNIIDVKNSNIIELGKKLKK
jgi:hypothetical protein